VRAFSAKTHRSPDLSVWTGNGKHGSFGNGIVSLGFGTVDFSELPTDLAFDRIDPYQEDLVTWRV